MKPIRVVTRQTPYGTIEAYKAFNRFARSDCPLELLGKAKLVFFLS